MILPLLLVLAQQQPLNGFDAYVQRGMRDWRVPGLAIVVVKDDSVAFIKGYGVRELGKPDPVTSRSRSILTGQWESCGWWTATRFIGGRRVTRPKRAHTLPSPGPQPGINTLTAPPSAPPNPTPATG
jgi:hypothetical protein